MTQWEHKLITTYLEPDKQIERELDVLGKAGWQLVAVAAVELNHIRYFFKRAIPDTAGRLRAGPP